MNWFSFVAPVFGALRSIPFKRSSHGLLGGICASLAEATGANVWIVRAVVVALGFLPVFGVGLYAVLWILLPDGLGKIHLETWLKELDSKQPRA